MPQHFHKHGYYTVSMGKIFHNHMPDRVSFDEADLRPKKYMTAEMIDREPESFYHDDALNEELARVRQRRLEKNPNAYAGGWAYGRSTESFDAPDNEFYDGAQTDLAIETLQRLQKKDMPFYVALGYYRPHLPFVAPKRYWKSAAFSQFHRNPRVTPDKGRYMGHSMVTSQYHYVEWRNWNHETGVAGDLVAVELYGQRSLANRLIEARKSPVQ